MIECKRHSKGFTLRICRLANITERAVRWTGSTMRILLRDLELLYLPYILQPFSKQMATDARFHLALQASVGIDTFSTEVKQLKTN